MKALVTGGGGFLGQAIVEGLLTRGVAVRSFSRGFYPGLEALGVEQQRGDLFDPEAVSEAVRGVEVVFHVAAKAGIWGPLSEYYRSNVVGTRNVLTACRQHQVRQLVFTSSPSVVFDGTDQEGIDESAPYPDHYHAHYPRTKAEAERMVLAANDEELATLALRPHLIWGPGDKHIVPRILARARAGQLRRIGEADNRVDTVYIDNAARAHLLAWDRLAPGSRVAGRAYFISQGEPIVIWDLIDRFLAAAGEPPVTRSAPKWFVYGAGAILETVHRLFRLPGEPRMTRFLARELATSHWFDISAARRDLDYQPHVSIEEGLRRLEEHFRSSGVST